MYHLILNINGQELVMAYGGGYLISTVDGLTGVNSRLDTVQAANGIGDTYTGGTVQGQPITVRGYILDHNVAAKQALIDALPPLGVGTLTVCNLPTGTSHRVTPYRVIDVVVRAAPTIEQKKHSKFAFTLYAPSATWYSTGRETLQLTNLIAETYTNNGQYPSDYELRLNAVEPIRQMTVYLDGIAPGNPYLYIDFTKYDPNGATGFLTFGRERGKTYLRVGNNNAIQCLSAQSTLWALPTGEHTLTISAGTDSFVGGISYAEAFAGVVLDGI